MNYSVERQDAISGLITRLKALRLARLARLLVFGKELHFLDKVRLNYRPNYQPIQITFNERPLILPDADSFLVTYEEIFIDRVYSFSSSTDAPVIVDCGANIGLATIFFKLLYPRGRILAIEADPKIANVLRKNVASFEFRDVEVIHAAVWNTDAPVAFTIEGGASGHISPSTETDASTNVPAWRLKTYLREKIDFLKMDIEGAEYEVLEDCREELRWVENIFVEYHSTVDTEQKLARVLSILANAGFRYHVRNAVSGAPHPFLERHLLGRMDLQLNIYGFRPRAGAN